MTRRRTILLILTAFCIALSTLCACEIRVRDSAFRTVRDVHKFCVIADGADESADSIQRRVGQWLEQTDGTFNLEIVRIRADDPETNWQSIGIPSAPPILPVTVLVGRDNGLGKNFVIDHYQPAPSDAELAAIINSPVRQRLARELAQNVAVLVFAPRDTEAQSSVTGRLKAIVGAGIEEERIGLSMITLDRTDPEELLLCKFMGLRPDSPDTLCVAFGRGKLMSPPLVGEQIDSENISKLVTQIRQACSCSRPLPTMGVDMPLIWSNEIDSTVILMDQELDLAELDGEVQNMLAAKASSELMPEPAVIPIPPGRQTAEPIVATDTASIRSVVITVGLGILLAFTLAFAIHRRRSPGLDSAR